MNNKLLIDFGASFVKYHMNGVTKKIPSPTPIYGEGGKVEINPYAYLEILTTILLGFKYIEEIWVCAEMHGFLLTDEDTGLPVTNYISWRDTRNSVEMATAHFRLQTGMQSSIGTPYNNIKNIPIHKNVTLYTLVDWLLKDSEDYKHVIHETMAQGTGFYSILYREWGATIYQSHVKLPTVTEDYFMGKIDGIPVYGGVGDFPAMLNGTIHEGCLINMGTGSQIVGDCFSEIRLDCHGKEVHCQTHIPCGRHLNIYANFFGKDAFWKCFHSLTLKEIEKAPLYITLGKEGAINEIMENNFSPRTVIAALARAWLEGYTDLLDYYSIEDYPKTITLAGGLSRVPFVRMYFENFHKEQGLDTAIILSRPITGEETLDGLLKLSGVYFGV